MRHTPAPLPGMHVFAQLPPARRRTDLRRITLNVVIDPAAGSLAKRGLFVSATWTFFTQRALARNMSLRLLVQGSEPRTAAPGLGVGRLVRQCPGMTLGWDGAVYLTNKGTSATQGEVLRLEVKACKKKRGS